MTALCRLNPALIRTPSEQKLEHLERLGRPLTDEESEMLRRAMHAIYCRQRRRG